MNSCVICSKDVDYAQIEEVSNLISSNPNDYPEEALGSIYCLQCCTLLFDSSRAVKADKVIQDFLYSDQVPDDFYNHQESLLKHYEKSRKPEEKPKSVSINRNSDYAREDDLYEIAIKESLNDLKLKDNNSSIEDEINIALAISQSDFENSQLKPQNDARYLYQNPSNYPQEIPPLDTQNFSIYQRLNGLQTADSYIVKNTPVNPSPNPSADKQFQPRLEPSCPSLIQTNQVDPKFPPVPSFTPSRIAIPNVLVASIYQPSTSIHQNPLQFYSIIKKIGTGSSGSIYMAQKHSTNEYFAIKILTHSSYDEKSLIINEVNLTINSHHINIIKYFEVYEHQSDIFIIEELMASAVSDLVLANPGEIPEIFAAYILREALKGLQYLHSRQRIHRDIKSDNILISFQGDIKIADLGFCAQVNRLNPKRTTFAGTLLWMAPEVLNQGQYNYKIDVWSLGVVAFELATGEPPYYRECQQNIVNNILKQSPPSLKSIKNCSELFNSFVSRCLIKDSSQRADCEELLKHPFITSCNCTKDEFQAFIESRKHSN